MNTNRKNVQLSLVTLGMSALLAFSLAGCSQGPLESAGEDADEAIEDAGEAIEDAGDDIADALEGGG